MKAFPSAIIAAILALCLCPALAFAQTGGDYASDEVQTFSGNLELNLIQSGHYVAPSSSQLATQGSSPLTSAQEEQLATMFAQACENVESAVDVTALRIAPSDAAVARFREILSEVVNSNPDLFYVNGGLKYYWTTVSNPRTGDQSYYTTLEIVYDYTSAQIATMKPKYDAALDEALSWVPSNATTAEKAKAIHDWLVRNCAYNTPASKTSGPAEYGSKNPWNAYGALVDKKAVCQGYSLAFCAAMSKLDIPATYVTQDSADHGWNRVQIDGTWYNLDVTFDDPIVNGKDQGFDAVPATDYFLKSDAWFIANPASNGAHTTWEPAGVPATDTRYDAYTTKDWPTYKAAAGEPIEIDNPDDPSNPDDPDNPGGQGGSSEPDDPGSSDDPGDSESTDPGQSQGASDPSSGQSGESASQGDQSGSAKPSVVTKQQKPIVVKGKTIKVKQKNLKKKKKLIFASSKAFKMSNAIGSITYKKQFGSGKIAIAKNGKVTVRKGLKKGKYGVIVSINTTGSLTYAPQFATATFTVQVK